MRKIAVIAALVAFPVCAILAAGRDAGIKEEFHKSYKLSPNGTVSLHNVNGDLEIKVWDKQEVQIDAVKYADDKECMDRLKIEVDATDNSIDVGTKYPNDHEDHDHGCGCAVDYVLTVPANANLDRVKLVNGGITVSGIEGDVRISSVNGKIEGENLKGSCELKTVNGAVHVSYVSMPSGKRITLESVNGPLELRVPGDANATVSAATQNGRVKNDFGLESADKEGSRWGPRIGERLKGDIGKGGTRIELQTVNGSIKLLKSEGSK